tara:strand:- start:26 stop:265 length:240 start_codon:yes stop_codon:yes gene_type:complete
MTNKYQTKYEHNNHKIAITDWSKSWIKKNPEKFAKNKQYADWVKKYNDNFDLFLSGKRSSEVLSSLDNLQDKINGKNTK